MLDTIKKVLTPVIPFDLIYDMDYGLMHLIKEKYRDSDTFFLGIVDADDKDLIYQLVNRTNSNPLSICARNLSSSDMELLYQDFLNKEYQTIVDHSIKTNLHKAVNIFCNSGTVTPSILCKNEIEENTILNDHELKGCTVLLNKDGYANFDTDLYDPIYFKCFSDALRCRTLDAKNIYIANYRFNLSTDDDNRLIPEKTLSILLLDHNRGSVVDVHNITEEYEAKG